MGLLDEILGQAFGPPGTRPGAPPPQNGVALLQGVLEMLAGASSGQRETGFDELQQRFQQAGLGDVIASWISTGGNRPIEPDDLTRALGRERVSDLSARAGLPAAGGAGILARLLPVLIDQLTPQGRPPRPEQLGLAGEQILRNLSASSTRLAGPETPMAEGPKKPDFSNVQSGASSTAPPPEPAAPAEPTYEVYTVVRGDNLSKIAKHFYGNANEWRRIFEANRDLLDDPDRIFPGQELKIPPRD